MIASATGPSAACFESTATFARSGPGMATITSLAMSDFVRTTIHGDVHVIDLDDGKANALSFAVIDGLNAALDASESSAGAVAIIGRDGKFSAGFDLKVMTSSIDDARRLLRAGAELALRVYMSPIPIVLGITGHALAMGGILATTADYRIGADGPFKLGLNEVAIGMPVPTFGVELCRDRLTHTWFTRCVQHAHLCTPAEAVAAGFLDELVAPADVRDGAIERAAHLAASLHRGPFRLTRNTMRAATAAALRDSLDADMALFEVTG